MVGNRLLPTQTSRQHRTFARLRGRSSSNRTWRYLPVPFFTVEVLTWRGLVTQYVQFFIETRGSRRVRLGGITHHPESSWIKQVACNATMDGNGYLTGCRCLLYDLGSAVDSGSVASSILTAVQHENFNLTGVRHDFSGAVRSGVNGTATVFQQGQKRHDADFNFDTLVEVIGSTLRS
jgi:hypothetical protein